MFHLPRKRRHSWPPVKILMEQRDESNSFDEDPFTFFLSTDDQNEALPEECSNAGVGTDFRAHSTSPVIGKRSVEITARNFTLSWVAHFRRLIRNINRRLFRRRDLVLPKHPDSSQDIYNPPDSRPRSPVMRGRDDARTGLGPPRHRHLRSHSERPRSWRKPSGDIWPLNEEQEDNGLGSP
ncbi:hypothetical protein MMC09_005870 [Bachmanniomyces sp. S44760]|nr:hypothetical protein [Bachmanniomyces sp. S44760]